MPKRAETGNSRMPKVEGRERRIREERRGPRGESVNKSEYESANVILNESVNESENKSANKSLNQSVSESANMMSNVSVNESTPERERDCERELEFECERQ